MLWLQINEMFQEFMSNSKFSKKWRVDFKGHALIMLHVLLVMLQNGCGSSKC